MMPFEMLITWKRYAGHTGIVARMKQHHKCMGCTALGCTTWGCTTWGCTAWDCTAWGCTAWGCTAWGCTAWDCIAWVALYKLYVFFCLGGGGGKAIPLSLGSACLIKPQFIITVINADCGITKS